MKQCIFRCLPFLFGLLLCQGSLVAFGASDDIREMKVRGVTLDPHGNTPIVILEDAKGHEAFPIWIGLPEARAIARALEGLTTPRPMTHTLLQNILGDLQVDVARIIINSLQNNTFYASITLRQGSKVITIDARPSDAIALALGVKAPIFVSNSVLGSVRTVTLPGPSPTPHPARKFGMHLQHLDATLASAFHLPDTKGVLVAFVEIGSLAEKYGVQRGDVITNVNGRPVNTLQDFLALFNAKQTTQDTVLHVLRDQQARTIRLSFAATD